MEQGITAVLTATVCNCHPSPTLTVVNNLWDKSQLTLVSRGRVVSSATSQNTALSKIGVAVGRHWSNSCFWICSVFGNDSRVQTTHVQLWAPGKSKPLYPSWLPCPACTYPISKWDRA
ncbi:unnamed protein product [Ostreobium quekettii]|uniref:Uncharacterized protein n=1 Tax=Ostreobium quekettii TaxID=121088 RepID=A0A8S1IYX9_9CHLO|nr:unnamed protein product [Ostreobium quekettii]